MARTTVTDLKLAIKHVNERMLGSDYSYTYDSRNGFHVVDCRKAGRLLFSVGIGTAKECIGALYSDAFDRLFDEATDRIGAAMTAKTTSEFRIKVVDGMTNVSYLIRKADGNLSYTTSGGVPLSLSNIARNKAMELSFALADATTLADAVAAVKRFGYSNLTVTGIERGLHLPL